jgi:hypothetical protein
MQLEPSATGEDDEANSNVQTGFTLISSFEEDDEEEEEEEETLLPKKGYVPKGHDLHEAERES